jgi:membrane protein YdbS with pleckstrin-like domain
MKRKEEISLEEQVARIRRKRTKKIDKARVRKYLNGAFLLLGAIGVIWYYTDSNNRIYALALIGISLIIKIVEFFIRIVL